MEWLANLLQWIVSPFDALTAHQLDTLRTLSSIAGTVLSGFAVAATVYARLARKDARAARQQTASQDWKNGVLVTTPVAESARHAAMSGEATRQEISDLGGWIRGTGRRRLGTDAVPRITPSSQYRGDTDEPG